MKANELLFWLSARREGSWRQFRAAVEELHSVENDSDFEGTTIPDDTFPLHQQLRLDLDRLAHVEFFTHGCTEGWRVAPPMLAAHSVHGGVRAVLCGARSIALCERILRAGENLGCETIERCDVPQVIRIAAPEEMLGEAAGRAGIHFQNDAPLAILSHLPPCDASLRSYARSEFPVGADWTVQEFDPAGLRWKKTDRRGAHTVRNRAIRFIVSFQRPRYFLRWAGETYELPRAIAIYAVLRRSRQHVLHYNAANRILSLPAICRPPRLLERGLVLCSGFPPSFDPTAARLTYCDVPPDIARYAAELLCQPLT